MRRVCAALMIVVLFSGATLTFKNAGQPTSRVAGTYANSQVDTVKYSREGGESAATFFMHCVDSSSVTLVTVRRVDDDHLRPIQAGDTLITATTALTDTVMSATVPLTQLNQQLWFFVTYAGTKNGVTSPTVTYGVNKRK